uniref:Putative secreted protein n=1 Tax=Ixodes ricinus TaxID=34613 RepID=V5HAG3_IXORI
MFLDDTLGALAMRCFFGSFLLVYGGSGNRPTCSSDEIKIQHRGTPSTPFFCLLCCVQLCSAPAVTANNFSRRIIVSSWTAPKSLPEECINLRLKGRDNSYFRAS